MNPSSDEIIYKYHGDFTTQFTVVGQIENSNRKLKSRYSEMKFFEMLPEDRKYPIYVNCMKINAKEFFKTIALTSSIGAVTGGAIGGLLGKVDMIKLGASWEKTELIANDMADKLKV
jgi:hypothetical protein